MQVRKGKGAFLLILILTGFFSCLHLSGAEVRLSIPGYTAGDTVTTLTASLTGQDYAQVFQLNETGGGYNGSLTVPSTGLYQVVVGLRMSSGAYLSDSARGYIETTGEIAEVMARLDPACFKTSLIVYWDNGTNVHPDQFYNLVLDTTVVKRLSIKGIDSIADAHYSEEMEWFRQITVPTIWLDNNLVPLVPYPFGDYRNPVTTCNTLFAFYQQYLREGDSLSRQGVINNANWLVQNHHEGYYHYEFDYAHTGTAVLKEPWVSAMAQGQALGALSQAFYLLGDSIYLQTADSVFTTLYQNSSDFWCFFVDEMGYYWLEEYPNDALCHVLNGKMFALFGVFQYYTVTRKRMALRILEAGLKSVCDHYKIWNIPNQDKSIYCLHDQYKEAYHLIHKDQLLRFAERFGLDQMYDAYMCLSDREIMVHPQQFDLSSQSQTATIHVNSVISWELFSDAAWIQVQKIPGQVSVSVEENLADQSRSAQILLWFKNNDSIYVEVMQEGVETLVDGKQNEFRIYPVPASQLLHLEWTGYVAGSQFRIYGPEGRLRISGPLEPHTLIDLSGLQPGIFYLVLTRNGRVIHRAKVIVAR